MYGSLVTDDTYKRADGIFKSMIEVFNPNLKDYISQGKAYERNVVEEAKSTKASQSAAVKIGIAATLSPGCKDVGKCIMDITDSMQEVAMAKDAWMKKYSNDVLYSMEQRCEQDGKYIANLRKKYQDEFKGKTSEAEKAMAAVTKLKKRSMNKPSTLKTDTKLQKTYEKLHSAKASTQTVAHEMLNRAFLEERRRYCYFVERKCQAVQALIEYYETSAHILKANLDCWIKVGNSQDELLPGAIALIESSKNRHSSSDGEGVFSKARNFNSQTLKETSSRRANKSSDHTNPPEQRRPISTISARKIDVYNNPYRTSSCASGDHQGPLDNKEYFSLTEDRLTLPVYASISKSAEMVFTEDAVHFREKPKPEVARRHASESVEATGWSLNGNRSSAEQKIHERSRETNDLSDNDDGDVFESPKIDGNYTNNQTTDDLPDKETAEKESNETESPARSETIYESLYDYIPEADGNKLELHRGDKIIICGSGESRGGWLYGENTRTYQKGWFPENYCKYKTDEDDNSPIEATDIQVVKRDGSSRDSRNIFRFSRDLERTLGDMKKNKRGRQSWQM